MSSQARHAFRRQIRDLLAKHSLDRYDFSVQHSFPRLKVTLHGMRQRDLQKVVFASLDFAAMNLELIFSWMIGEEMDPLALKALILTYQTRIEKDMASRQRIEALRAQHRAEQNGGTNEVESEELAEVQESSDSVVVDTAVPDSVLGIGT